MTLTNEDLEELIYRVLQKCPYDDDKVTAGIIKNSIVIVEMLDLKV